MYWRILGSIILLAALCYPQSAPREMRSTFENLSFFQGMPGIAPPGWLLGPEWFLPPHTPVYAAETAAGAACYSGRQCGTIFSLREDPSERLAFLYQVVDASPYRGKTLNFRAAVRAEVAPGSAARLLVRVHRADGSTSFRDDMGDHPVTSVAWGFHEINAPVGLDAGDIELGMQLVGSGAAWIDDISVSVSSPDATPDESIIRALIQRFADARNAHDGPAAADTYSEDGEYIWATSSTPHAHGRAALAAVWGGVIGQVSRTVSSVEFLSPQIAVVRVNALDFNQGVSFKEIFLVVENERQWKIRVHQLVSIGSSN